MGLEVAHVPTAMSRKRFLLFGDSLTQQSFNLGGWGGRLTSAYQRKADITLRGFSGYNTRWILHLLDAVLPTGPSQTHYDLATIWFGANDAALPNRSNARQHVPLPEYVSNLEKLIDRIESLGAEVIVITPPPVDEPARLKLAQQEEQPEVTGPERTLFMAGQYAQAAKEVAEKRGLPVLDLWTLLQKVPKWQTLLTDGLHFAPDGNEVVFNFLMDFINQELPHFREEALPTDFPLNLDIDADKYQESFLAHAELHFH